MILRVQRWLFILIGALLILVPSVPIFVSSRALPELASTPPADFTVFTGKVDDIAATYVGAGNALLKAAQEVRSLGRGAAGMPAVEGKDGWLFLNSQKLKNRRAGIRVNYSNVQAWLGRAEALYAEQKARGGRLIVVPAPDKATIYPELAPYSAVSKTSDSLDVFLQELGHRGIPALDLRPIFLDQRKVGPLYSPVDTHWNKRAALIAYNAILGLVGEEDAMIPIGSHFKGYRTGVLEGDLSRMLQRGPREVEIPAIDEELFDSGRFTRTEAIATWPLPKGAFSLMQKGSSETGAAGVSVIIIGDSFSNDFLTPLFAHNFDGAVWLHHSNEPLDPALMEALAPDIVVLEFVERILE